MAGTGEVAGKFRPAVGGVEEAARQAGRDMGHDRPTVAGADTRLWRLAECELKNRRYRLHGCERRGAVVERAWERVASRGRGGGHRGFEPFRPTPAQAD